MAAQLARKHTHTEIPDSVIADMRLGARALLVYMILARHAGKKQSAFPSIRRIAKLARSTPKTVQKSLHELFTLGYIGKTHRKRIDKGKSSNLYTLYDTPLFDAPIGAKVTQPHTGESSTEELKELVPEVITLAKVPVAPNGANGQNETNLIVWLKEAFSRRSNQTDWDWTREGSGLSRLAKAMSARPEPINFAKACLVTYWKLIHSDEHCFKSQPFLPSVMASGGIWPRIVRAVEEQPTNVIDEVLKEVGQ